MLRDLMETVGLHEGVVYVGDPPDDRRAARDARVSFQLADDFFLPSVVEPAAGPDPAVESTLLPSNDTRE